MNKLPMMLGKNFFVKWFKEHGRSFPWRSAGVSPFALLMTEMLLRQTRATEVAKVWHHFMMSYPNARSLSEASKNELRATIGILGFGTMRTDALILAAKWLVNNCSSEVPHDLSGLLKIPHVGSYAAHAVLCFAYGEKKEIVDVNVMRFFARYYGMDVTPDIRRNPHIAVHARRALPRGKDQAKDHNYGLLDFAADICKPRAPLCDQCPLKASCAWGCGLVQITG